MKRIVLALIVAALVAPAALADITYRSRQRTEPEKGKPVEMIVHGWIKGEKAKILFEEVEANPMMRPGNYLIADGETIYMVNPEDETYSEFSLDQLLALSAGVLEAMEGFVDIQVEDPSVERVASRAGEAILGVPTEYNEFRTSYAMTTKVLGFRNRSEIEMHQKIWSTREPVDEGLGVWFRREPPKMGIEGLDELLAAEFEKTRAVGFPIQQETTTVTRNYKKNGKLRGENTSKQTTTMLEWDETTVPAETFEIPDHYELVQIDPTAAQGEEDGKKGRPRLKDLFKRN